jgi:isocitrate dehydrogenase
MSPREPTNLTPLFFTERLQLAIFIHASQRLRFAGCEPTEAGRVRFVFHDPEQIGSQVELDFDRGATVSACSIFASQKFLRRQMSAALENLKNGVYEHSFRAV